jgi:hypothetical protein
MKWLISAVIAILALARGTYALGHGHPIMVTAANNRLVVSGGVAGASDGFAGQIFVETDSAGDPQDFSDFTNFGPAIYWIVPGFEISGLAENSGLYLQTIARPVINTNPVESRALWYWDPNSSQADKVEVAPSDSRLQIRHSASVNTVLDPSTSVAPSQIKIADPVAADMGFHNHDLVKYLLPYPLPDDGAYAFFARLTSDVYGPSDPFLVVINNGGLEGSQMLDAAATINRDALIAGDFDRNDRVNAADYATWRKTLNTAASYAAWRENFGLSASSSAPLGAGNVPEPSSGTLMAGTIFLMCASRRRRRFEKMRRAAYKGLARFAPSTF